MKKNLELKTNFVVEDPTPREFWNGLVRDNWNFSIVLPDGKVAYNKHDSDEYNPEESYLKRVAEPLAKQYDGILIPKNSHDYFNFPDFVKALKRLHKKNKKFKGNTKNPFSDLESGAKYFEWVYKTGALTGRYRSKECHIKGKSSVLGKRQVEHRDRVGCIQVWHNFYYFKAGLWINKKTFCNQDYDIKKRRLDLIFNVQILPSYKALDDFAKEQGFDSDFFPKREGKMTYTTEGKGLETLEVMTEKMIPFGEKLLDVWVKYVKGHEFKEKKIAEQKDEFYLDMLRNRKGDKKWKMDI